ncbi:unnamed protein product [Nippostrongylus brasiliensis]|uniref:Uncharacterized protein n=1 Tax=Nippostrongylus brasiliensis TaxID=27835 RepID=A0A0N4YQA9_NIPBR|nr:unnamed protein product [Nippostrongylus brasiliensis]
MGSTVGRPTPKKKPGKKSKEQTKKTKKVEPRKAKSMFARLHVTSKTSNKKKKKKSKKKPKKKNKSMRSKPAESPQPVEDDTETNTTESVASTGATRTVIEMKPPSRSSGKRDQVAEPDTVAQKPKKREKKSASLPNVGRTARTQPDGSAYEASVPKEVTDKERDS